MPAPAVANETVAHRIVAALARHGVEKLIGQSIPTLLYLVAAEQGIEQITVRTEKAAAMLADGYARLSGKVPVCTSIGGPGAALLTPGLGEAMKSSVPVVALVQDVPIGATDRNAAQDIDQATLLRPCTKLVRRMESGDRVEELIDLAFATAASGRPGPVALLLPENILRGPAPAARSNRSAVLGRFPLDRMLPDPERLEAAAELLAAAERPIVVAGGGVHLSAAHAALARLQELASLPVATTTMGKGAVSEMHPLSLGPIGYAMGKGAMTEHLAAFVHRADVVLLVGTRTNQTGTDSWSALPNGARYVHIDVDGQEIGRNYEALRLVGDAALSLDALADRLARLDLEKRNAARSSLAAEIAAARTAHEKDVHRLLHSERAPIRPERVMWELGQQLPEDAVVVADASYATLWMQNYLIARRPGDRFISPRGLAGIGWGFPIALGVKLAEPERPVFCIAGDGGFAHAWAELETAKRHRLALTVVVLNNAVLGYQKDAEDVHFGAHTPGCHFEAVDHAAIAEACGCKGIRVAEPGELSGALRAAARSEVPVLIDVLTDPDAYPPLTSFDGRLPPAKP